MKKRASSKKPDDSGSKETAATTGVRDFVADASLQEALFRSIEKVSARAAEGDIQSFDLLIRLSIKIGMDVQKLTNLHFEVARKVARHTPFWPVLLSPSPNLFRDNQLLIKRLELGVEFAAPIELERALREATIPRKIAVWLLLLTNCLRRFYQAASFEMSAKQILGVSAELSSDAARKLAATAQVDVKKCEQQKIAEVESANTWLQNLAEEMWVSYDLKDILSAFAERAHKLPPLSQSTVKNWAAFGKEIIMTLNDQHPERNPILYELGKYRQDAHYRKDTTPGTFSERKRTAKASEESNVRDGIFTRIKAAYAAVTANGITIDTRSDPRVSPQQPSKNKGET